MTEDANPRAFRRRASELRKHAHSTANKDAKTLLLRIAQDYEAMAKNQAKRRASVGMAALKPRLGTLDAAPRYG